MKPAEEFSTLVHEIAHEMLHRGDRRTLTTKQDSQISISGSHEMFDDPPVFVEWLANWIRGTDGAVDVVGSTAGEWAQRQPSRCTIPVRFPYYGLGTP